MREQKHTETELSSEQEPLDDEFVELQGLTISWQITQLCADIGWSLYSILKYSLGGAYSAEKPESVNELGGQVRNKIIKIRGYEDGKTTHASSVKTPVDIPGIDIDDSIGVIPEFKRAAEKGEFSKKLSRYAEEVEEKKGTFAGLFKIPMWFNIYSTADPRVADQLLKTFNLGRGVFDNIIEMLFGSTLLSKNFKEWRTDKNSVNGLLNPERINSATFDMLQAIDDALNELEKNASGESIVVEDLQMFLRKLIVRLVSIALFKQDLGSDQRFVDALDAIITYRSEQFNVPYISYPIACISKIYPIKKVLGFCIPRIPGTSAKKRHEDLVYVKLIINAAINRLSDNDKALFEKLNEDSIIAVFIAASDTTQTTSINGLDKLSKDESSQNKIYQAISDKINTSKIFEEGGLYYGLPELQFFLRAVLLEYPPVRLLPRFVDVPMTINGCPFKRNEMFIFSIDMYAQNGDFRVFNNNGRNRCPGQATANKILTLEHLAIIDRFKIIKVVGLEKPSYMQSLINWLFYRDNEPKQVEINREGSVLLKFTSKKIRAEFKKRVHEDSDQNPSLFQALQKNCTTQKRQPILFSKSSAPFSNMHQLIDERHDSKSDDSLSDVKDNDQDLSFGLKRRHK